MDSLLNAGSSATESVDVADVEHPEDFDSLVESKTIPVNVQPLSKSKFIHFLFKVHLIQQFPFQGWKHILGYKYGL